jgi:hypothetical protein
LALAALVQRLMQLMDRQEVRHQLVLSARRRVVLVELITVLAAVVVQQ